MVAAKRMLLQTLRDERATGAKGGIYHKTQVELAYNSNHIEGSRLTHEQTRCIYEANAIAAGADPVNVDDIVETVNHFRCFDLIIDGADEQLNEKLIQSLHATLKRGTSDARKPYFALGDYKKLPNMVGGRETTAPELVAAEMESLLSGYNRRSLKTLEELLEFHVAFESIHPFQDGNGRVGRLVLFKECLRNDIVPFIIEDQFKWYYYRGLHEWQAEKGYLLDTCLSMQDRFKAYLDYFRIGYRQGDQPSASLPKL